MLNINHLLRLIINLQILNKLSTYAALLSRLRLPFPRLLRKLCNAFYLFTKTNTHFASGKVTRVHSQPLYPRPPREKERERKESSLSRTTVLLGTPKL